MVLWRLVALRSRLRRALGNHPYSTTAGLHKYDDITAGNQISLARSQDRWQQRKIHLVLYCVYISFYLCMTLLVFPVAKYGEEEKVFFRRIIFLMEFLRMITYPADWARAGFLLIVIEAAPWSWQSSSTGNSPSSRVGYYAPCKVLGTCKHSMDVQPFKIQESVSNIPWAFILYSLVFCLIQSLTHLWVHARIGRGCTWAQIKLNLYFPWFYFPCWSVLTLRSPPYVFV